jgi:hypothetical protein
MFWQGDFLCEESNNTILFPNKSDSPSDITIWEKQIDNNGNADGATNIIKGTDGNFIIVGSTGPVCLKPEYNSDGLVIKINPDGEIIWQKQFGGKGTDMLSSGIVKGEHFLITGCKWIPQKGRDIWLLELDKDGNIVKEKTFGSNYNDGVAQIISTPDNGYLLIGETKSSIIKKSDVWLIKLDENFDILWSKTYDLGGEDTGVSIAPIGNENFIFIANTYTKNYGGLFQQSFANYVVIDQKGNILKKQIFNKGPKNKFTRIKPTIDGGAVIVGATSIYEKFPSEDIWILKLDKNADVEWTKVYISPGRYDGGFDILQVSDGGYVVIAYSQVQQTPDMNFDNFCLMRLNYKGDILWTRIWGGPDNDDLLSIIPVGEKTFIAVGVKGSISWPLNRVPGNSDIYVIKIRVD